MSSFAAVLLVWVALLVSRSLSQCPELTESLVRGLTEDQAIDDNTEGQQVTSVVLNDHNINCLAVAPSRGYKEAIYTVNYTTNAGLTQTR